MINKRLDTSLVYKESGKMLKVSSIESKSVTNIKTGDFLDEKKKRWDISFEGYAGLAVAVENDHLTSNYKIQGYAKHRGNRIKHRLLAYPNILEASV